MKTKMKIGVRFELADVQKKHDSFTSRTIEFMKDFVNKVYSHSNVNNPSTYIHWFACN